MPPPPLAKDHPDSAPSEIAATISPAPIALPRELRTFLLINCTLWLLSLAKPLVLFATTRNVNSFDSIAMANPFFDFYVYLSRLLHRHSANFFTAPGFPWNYPAPSVFVYSLYYAIDRRSHISRFGFYCFLVSVAAILAFIMRRLVRTLARYRLPRPTSIVFLLLSLAFSWPIYFAIERGNIELLLWLGVAAGVWCYLRNRWWLAAIFLGTTAAFKLYPVLCLALFLPAKRFKELAAGILTMAVATLVALAYIGPSIPYAFHATQTGVANFVSMYTLKYDPLASGYDHSVFGIVKVLFLSHPASYAALLHLYMLAIALIMTALFFWRIVHLPRPSQVLALIVATVLLPPTSFDYTLQSLYVPWALLALLCVAAQSRSERIPGMMAAMICFGLLLGPETFLQWHGVIFAGQFKALVLITLTAISLLYPFHESKVGKSNVPASIN